MSLALLTLQSGDPKELLEDFDVLSKWIDCASPVDGSPPPPTCDNHRACPAIADHGLYAWKCNNICQMAGELLLFPATAYLRRGSLICEAVCVKRASVLDWVLLPYSHATSTRRSLYVGCSFGAWCSLESGSGNNLQPTSFAAPSLLGIKGLHEAQTGNFTESLGTKGAD